MRCMKSSMQSIGWCVTKSNLQLFKVLFWNDKSTKQRAIKLNLIVVYAIKCYQVLSVLCSRWKKKLFERDTSHASQSSSVMGHTFENV